MRELNADLLDYMTDADNARELFDWLCSLSFIEPGAGGIRPHELVRKVLMQNMPAHFPGRYETLVKAAINWIVDRIEAAGQLTWTQAATLAADGMYALRAVPIVHAYLYPIGTETLYVDRATPGDWPLLADMVREHESAESRHWLEFWQQRCPQALRVIRDSDSAPSGGFLMLAMEDLEPDARDEDPVTAALWHVLKRDFAPRPGDHLPFIRHWMTPDYSPIECPVKTQILMAINTYNLLAHNLRVTAQIFDERPEWR